jgi:hypothetical protein
MGDPTSYTTTSYTANVLACTVAVSSVCLVVELGYLSHELALLCLWFHAYACVCIDFDDSTKNTSPPGVIVTPKGLEYCGGEGAWSCSQDFPLLFICRSFALLVLLLLSIENAEGKKPTAATSKEGHTAVQHSGTCGQKLMRNDQTEAPSKSKPVSKMESGELKKTEAPKQEKRSQGPTAGEEVIALACKVQGDDRDANEPPGLPQLNAKCMKMRTFHVNAGLMPDWLKVDPALRESMPFTKEEQLVLKNVEALVPPELVGTIDDVTLTRIIRGYETYEDRVKDTADCYEKVASWRLQQKVNVGCTTHGFPCQRDPRQRHL